MINQISIENFKSVEKIRLNLGRVNLFIGENGGGKSNILEAIALASAAEAGKLDNEFLVSRGIRVSSARLMRSGFKDDNYDSPIVVEVKYKNGHDLKYEMQNDNLPYSSWKCKTLVTPEPITELHQLSQLFSSLLNNIEDPKEREIVAETVANSIKPQLKDAIEKAEANSKTGKVDIKISFSISESDALYKHDDGADFKDFIIYSPENSSLRTFEREGQIEPLGINGEGLLRFLEVIFSDKSNNAAEEIKELLRLFGWFEDFKFRKRKSVSRFDISDVFLSNGLSNFDQRSANEGFLFVAFYAALLTSNITPKFFAIDNIDTALNPKLCQEIMTSIVRLAKKYDKQLILTTHNPSILDGLDLNDSDQRLFVVSRGPRGQTRARHFERKPLTDQPTRLSELFISGALGGLPKAF